jgi:hypothetical protein
MVGHTHNNCDRTFGICERKFKKQAMYHPTGVLSALKNTKGLDIKLIEKFKNYKSILNYYVKDLKGIHDAAEILISENNPTLVNMTQKTLSCGVSQIQNIMKLRSTS